MRNKKSFNKLFDSDSSETVSEPEIERDSESIVWRFGLRIFQHYLYIEVKFWY